MKFDYQGLDLASQSSAQGEIEAHSEAEAIRQLRQRRIEVIKLTVQKEKVRAHRKVQTADLVLPLQELATLTESGVVLVDALHALAKNKSHPALAKGFAQLASRIESGDSFSAAIAESNLPFPPYVEYLVSAGELSGELATALRNASTQLNYDDALKNDLRSALTYPMVLIGAGISAMLIIFFTVVPKFVHLLEQNNELPFLATLVLGAGKFANDNPLFLAATAGGVVITVIALASNKAVRHRAMNIAIELPIIGPWLAEQDAARWAALCGAMLNARVSLLSALTLSAEASDFTRRKKRALNIANDIQAGVSMSEAIERAAILPGTSLNLIAVGDKTGKLAEMMTAVARLHDEACKRRMKQVMTLIEPVAILVVGVLIGIMVLGIVLAMTASTDAAL